MKAFLEGHHRKAENRRHLRRKLDSALPKNESLVDNSDEEEEDAPTDIKLAILASLHPEVDQDTLLDLLIGENGSVKAVTKCLALEKPLASPRKRSAGGVGHQTSLSVFTSPRETLDDATSNGSKKRALTRKGQTLHLYAPEDIANHTPCSIIHNFLTTKEADDLLRELLEEAPTYGSVTFKLFDTVVQSPHTACFYVQSLEEERRQRTEYLYNGSYLSVLLFPLD